MLEVGDTFGLDHRFGYAQRDAAVDFRAGLAVLDSDLIAEEGRGAGSGVRDQGLFLVQFQREVLPEEPGQALPDLLCFGLRPGEPEEVVVGIAGVAEPPVAGITGIPGGQAALLLAQFPRFSPVAA